MEIGNLTSLLHACKILQPYKVLQRVESSARLAYTSEVARSGRSLAETIVFGEA